MYDYECSEEAALSAFYLESGMYRLSKICGSNDLKVYSQFNKDGGYTIKSLERVNSLCKGTTVATNNRMRCNNYATMKGYCPQHSPIHLKSNGLSNIKEETDIEKLRAVCIVVYNNYHHLWDNIITEAKKKLVNRKTLIEINNLQLKINELKKGML